MSSLFFFVSILIAVFIAVCLHRVRIGPTVFDRVIGVSLIGTNGMVLLLLIGFLYERVDMFVDIAITYALLNFVMIILLAKYFERKDREP